jgi:cytochrome c oxidase subunit II
VPGITTNFKATTTGERGSYPVVCAELCGLGHSVMRQTATVMPQQEYETWLNEQAQAAAGDAGGGGAVGGPRGDDTAGEPPDGEALFASDDTRCAQCHTLEAAGSTGSIGPDLDEGLAGQDEEFIRQSIVDPNAEIADGYQEGIMPPNYGDTLSPEEVDALVTYLTEATR